MVETSRDFQAAFRLPPGATEVILVRHGSSATPVEARPFPLVGGQSDPPLAPQGHEQARALADRLGGEPVAALFVTPLRRTAQTAQPLAQRLGISPVVVPELREVGLGEWEVYGGLSNAAPEREALVRRILDEESWGLIPGGEDPAAFGARVREGLETVARATGPDRVAVAVVHGGVVAEACRQATGSTPFAFFATENGSITRLIRQATGRFTLRSYNDTSHLR